MVWSINSRHAVQTRDQVFVVFRRPERGRGNHLGDVLLHAAHLIDLEELERKLVAFDRKFGIPPVKVVADRIGGGEFCPVDRLDDLEVEFVGFLVPGDGFEG